jgi:hypothetical protein
MSALYACVASLRSSVAPITHPFLHVDNLCSKLQPSGPGYELVYGAAGVPTYLWSLTPEGTLEAAFVASAAHESALCDHLLKILRGYVPHVRIVGDANKGSSCASTISFVAQGIIGSLNIVNACDDTGTVRRNVLDAASPLLDAIGGCVCGRLEYDTVTFTRTPWWTSWTHKSTSMTESYGYRRLSNR